MYRNLEAELVRNGISKERVAETINKSYQTATLKLNGKYSFTLDEAFKIKNNLFPNLSIEYLFQTELAS